MKRVMVFATCLFIAVQVPATAAPKVNTKCTKVQQRSGALICLKIKGKLIWRPFRSGPVVTPTPTPTATAVDYSPASTGAKVNREGLTGRTIMGYQGWFSCSKDDTGPSWDHWFDANKPATAPGLTVDFWPDVSEYSADELCPTEMTTEGGEKLNAYSGYNQTVLNRHFSWMQTYGIDGVAIQRFVTRLEVSKTYSHDYLKLKRLESAAQRYGRVFYMEYDLSGVNNASQVALIKKDWKRTVDEGIVSSTSQITVSGLPVVELWGLGIPGVNELSAAEVADLISFFKNNPEQKYRAFVIGGVGSYWREGTGDGSPGADWARTYRSLDAINPWSVGRYGSKYAQEAQAYLQNVVVGDLSETQRLGILYIPVVWPGFSWTNLMRNRNSSDERNAFPRYCGSFYWQQVVNVLQAGAKTVFIAMFDEVDEGTAMYKLVTTQRQLPSGSQLVPLDIDGCTLKSDFYLRLASATADATRRGVIPTRTLPFGLESGESLGAPSFGVGRDGQPTREFSRGL